MFELAYAIFKHEPNSLKFYMVCFFSKWIHFRGGEHKFSDF